MNQNAEFFAHTYSNLLLLKLSDFIQNASVGEKDGSWSMQIVWIVRIAHCMHAACMLYACCTNAAYTLPILIK